ncbi:hypothetical protein GCM10027425_14750 [Alteromonas gracilis]
MRGSGRVRRLGCCLLVIASVLLGGCGGEGQGDLLDLGQSPGTICVPRADSELKTFGAMDVRNTSESVVRLSRIELTDARGLSVAGARVVTATNESQLVGDGWPPRGMAEEFRRGTPLSERELQPGEQVTVWTGVRATAQEGSAGAIRVHYLANGELFSQDGVDALRVARGSSC